MKDTLSPSSVILPAETTTESKWQDFADTPKNNQVEIGVDNSTRKKLLVLLAGAAAVLASNVVEVKKAEADGAYYDGTDADIALLEEQRRQERKLQELNSSIARDEAELAKVEEYIAVQDQLRNLCAQGEILVSQGEATPEQARRLREKCSILDE